MKTRDNIIQTFYDFKVYSMTVFKSILEIVRAPYYK